MTPRDVFQFKHNMLTPTLDLAKALIERKSLTPDDAGCQKLMIERLEQVNFNIQRMRFGSTDNFWARRGEASPVVCFVGHTDESPPARSNCGSPIHFYLPRIKASSTAAAQRT